MRMYVSRYDDNFMIMVESFEPGAKAMFFNGFDMIDCEVAEVVKYDAVPSEDQQNQISNIEEWGYTCTGEFIEDNCCYFVAVDYPPEVKEIIAGE